MQQENERNKQVFTERIVQLQNEIDLLIKEKKQQTQNSKYLDLLLNYLNNFI